jgi:anti-anti-sigma regulatory factor
MECWVFQAQSRELAASTGAHRMGRYRADRLPAAEPAPQDAAFDGDGGLQAAYLSPPPTLYLAGEIDEATYQDLLLVLERAAATDRQLLQVDLADVVYCDLAGLRAILSLAQPRSAGSARIDQLVLRRVSVQLRTVIRVLGWNAAPGLFFAEPVS